MRMKTLLLGLAAGIFLFGCGKPTDISNKRLAIATGSKSGIYYPVGEVLAKIIKEKFKDVQVEVIVTEGSIQNLSLLQEGKANLALVQNDIAHYALFGENMYAGKKIASITGLATLFPEVVHIITHKNLNITNLAGLEGKKVALGTENSGTFYNAQQILTHGKVWDKILRVDLNPVDSIGEFEKGTVDAFFFSSGLPNAKIADLASRAEIAFIPLEPELIQDLVNTFPFYFPSEIPDSAYPGAASTVPAIEINSLLVANLNLPESDQYLIAKTVFQSLETLKVAHPVLNILTPNSIRRQMTVPLSTGALNAFSE